MAKRLPKTTKMQYEELLNFVEQNKILLRGKITASKADKIEKLWQEFAVKINAKGLGAPKTARQWRKVFNEWKVNTKRKIKVSTGDGSNNCLSDLQERLLTLLLSKDEFSFSELDRNTDTGTEIAVNETAQEELPRVMQLPFIKQDTLSSEEEISNVNQEHHAEYSKATSELEEPYLDHAYVTEAGSNSDPQQNTLELDKMNAHALNNLASAINNLANAKKSEAEALHLLAKAKMLCAKAKYYKVCNKTLDEFEV